MSESIESSTPAPRSALHGARPAAPPPPRAPEWMRVRARSEADGPVKARVLPPPMPHGKRAQMKRSGSSSAILLKTLDVVDERELAGEE